MTEGTNAPDKVQAVQVITVEGVEFSNPVPGIQCSDRDPQLHLFETGLDLDIISVLPAEPRRRTPPRRPAT